MGSIDIPPKFIPVPPKPKRSISERIADAIESVQLYAARKIFIDAQLADRGGVPRIKFKDTLVPVMYADRDGFLQPEGWWGWTATMNVTFTQANVAGGAVVVEIIPGSGQEFDLGVGRIVNSGTNDIIVDIRTVAGGATVTRLFEVASGAGTIGNFSPGSVSTTTGKFVTNQDAGLGYPVRVSGVQALAIRQSGAGAQNDTFNIAINIRVKHKSQMPTVITANSTNPADVSATAGAASFAVVE